MLGLKHAGKFYNYRLQLHLSKFGCALASGTPSLCKHASKNITFALVIKNFGVKYVGKQNAEHLIQVLQQLYTISIDCKGTLLCVLTIDWYY